MDVRASLNNIELPLQAPEWVELLPPGPAVTGRDGRAWAFGPAEATAVLHAFHQHNGPLPIDWEHASEHRAPNGLDAPAAGWITELEIRDGALWGRVEWTSKAIGQIARKEYRFLSPVFLYSKSGQRIQKLVSAGLTNQPNLKMTALNQYHHGPNVQTAHGAALSEDELEICRIFGNDPEEYLRTKNSQIGEGIHHGSLEQKGMPGAAITAEEREICRLFGTDPEDYLKYRG